MNQRLSSEETSRKPDFEYYLENLDIELNDRLPPVKDLKVNMAHTVV